MDLHKKRGRNPVEQDKISAYVRKKIISGKWTAGQKIPTRLELGRKFGVTVVTVQRTLAPLVSDGFLRVDMNKERGTYVNETPPHLFNYAHVFASVPSGNGWNMFFATQLNVSKNLQKELGIKIMPYFGLDGYPSRPDYIRLVNDIRKERLAGIIFATSIHMIENTPAVLEGGIPRVIIGSGNKKNGIPGITPTGHAFIEKSLDYLESRNCRRIAFILVPGLQGDFTDRLKISFARRKLVFVPQWHQVCNLEYAEAAANVVRLLMSLPKDGRPNAILVGDDNLIEPVCEGLKLAGVKVPGEVEIVSHCNFPRTSMPSLPVKFIGYDIHGLMLGCIEILKLQKSSGKIAQANFIDACTDEEYALLRSSKKI
ncbi:MAG: hypothetical protein A2X45_21135 [Lentisphaerae bacterium GWF2_50_93]|nr:MAG: hypothetical protein A2X45_21135 [Lentisphaerae bacterium GWF2_50_93]